MTLSLVADASGTFGTIQINGVDKLKISSNGALEFLSPGSRISADMSNGSQANRLAFQSNVVNGATIFGLIPNGAGNTSAVEVFGGSNPTSTVVGQLAVIGAAEVRLSSTVSGAGTIVPMTFFVGGAERLRIDTNGQIRIGAFNQMGGKVEITYDKTTYHGMILRQTADTGGGGTVMQFLNAAESAIGSISSNATNVTYNTSSDYRLKNTISPLVNSGAIIDALQPKTWLWNVDGSPGAGFLAHEFQAVFPDSVTGVFDGVDDDLNPVYQVMDASTPAVIAVIIAELKDIRARLDAGGI